MPCLCGEAGKESSPNLGWRALQEAEQSSTNYEASVQFESELFCPLLSVSGGGGS